MKRNNVCKVIKPTNNQKPQVGHRRLHPWRGGVALRSHRGKPLRTCRAFAFGLLDLLRKSMHVLGPDSRPALATVFGLAIADGPTNPNSCARADPAPPLGWMNLGAVMEGCATWADVWLCVFDNQGKLKPSAKPKAQPHYSQQRCTPNRVWRPSGVAQGLQTPPDASRAEMPCCCRCKSTLD